jgi:hypothetical protein
VAAPEARGRSFRSTPTTAQTGEQGVAPIGVWESEIGEAVRPNGCFAIP